MLLSSNIENTSFASRDSGARAPRLRHKRLAACGAVVDGCDAWRERPRRGTAARPGWRVGTECALPRGMRLGSEARRGGAASRSSASGCGRRSSRRGSPSTARRPTLRRKSLRRAIASAEQALRAGIDDLNAGNAASSVDALTYAAEGGRTDRPLEARRDVRRRRRRRPRRREGIPLLQSARRRL